MADADQGNNGTGQEPGAGGTQGTGQEPANTAGGQGQEPGTQDNGLTDLSTFTPEQLRTYAEKVQKDAQEARAEAAKHRTTATGLQAKITEAERAAMSDQEKVQADLTTATEALTAKEAENQQLREQITDLTEGAKLREALGAAGAHDAQVALGQMDRTKLEKAEDGSFKPESITAQVTALRQTHPFLFKRGPAANAGDGAGGGAPTTEGGINGWIRGQGRPA